MISRFDFDKILREYDELQLESARELSARKAAVYKQIPELSEIDAAIAKEAVACAEGKIRGGNDASGCAVIRELKNRRVSVLKEYGYGKEILEPRYICSECRDTGYTDGEMCSCLKRRITDILYNQSNIREFLEEENFGTFSLKYYPDNQIPGLNTSARNIAKKAAEAAKKFVSDFDSGSDNLFIYGATGTGKTFLSNCIAKELLDTGHFVLYLSAVKLFDLLAEASFGNRKKNDSYPAASGADLIEDQILGCDLLIIDDLGTEIVNTFTASRLFNCINDRLLSRKHTIISTNLSLEQLQLNYSERIFSRIASNYIRIKLYGDDIRMKKKLEAL